MINDESSKKESFAELMTGVQKISSDRINIYRDRTKNTAQPKRNDQNAESNLDFTNISNQQRFDIRDSQFDNGIQKKLQRRIRQGQLPIEDRLDLHGYTQKEAIAALEEFLHCAVSAQFKLIMFIHGKGDRSADEAVLRPLVRHWLAQQSSVLAWCPAQPKHGGAGASYVYLRAPG